MPASGLPRRILPALAAFLIPASVELLAASQGFNLLDDGLWLLGADLLRDGGVLYRDLFAIYGPAKFVLLAPFLALTGNALALACLKGATVGAGALLGFLAARRGGAGRLAWLVPFGALALEANRPRYAAAGLLALLTARVVGGSGRPRDWALLGLAWAGLASFGLDAAAYGGVIIVGTCVLARDRRPRGRLLASLGGGLAAGLGALALLALVTGSLGPAVWDTVVYPLTRFGDEMGLSPLDSFRSAGSVGALFVEHQTGEAFAPAWPLHAESLALGRRLLYLGLVLLPLAGIAAAWRRRDDALLAAVTAFALAGWSTAAVRGEAVHLACGWLGSLWLLPLLAARAAPRRRRPAAAAAVLYALVALGPLLLEPVWLAARADRPGLAVWDRPAAGIRLSQERIEGLELLGDYLAREVHGPAVFWPVQPGLNFFFEVPLATSQATLLGGEVRDADAVLRELERHPDRAVLLGLQPGDRRRSNKDVAPDLWDGLRRTHVVAARLTGGPDEFTILTAPPAGTPVAQVPLDARLPDERQTVATAATPALRPGDRVGQSFPVGGLDLSGVALRLLCDRDAAAVATVSARALADGRPGAELGSRRLELRLARGQNLYHLPFRAIPGTAGRTVLLELTLAPADGAAVRVLWNEGEDVYPGGRAWWNGRATRGDLYFLSY